MNASVVSNIFDQTLFVVTRVEMILAVSRGSFKTYTFPITEARIASEEKYV